MQRARVYSYIVYAALALGAVLAFRAWMGRHEDASPVASGVPSRRAAPDVSFLQKSEGGALDMKALRGNVVVVHFWASWCPPCLEELGYWVKAAEKYEGRSVRFLAISLDENWADSEKLLPRNGLPSTLISTIDPEKKSSELFGSFQFPESYLLDKNLRIAQKLVGPQDWESERLREWIDQLEREN